MADPQNSAPARSRAGLWVGLAVIFVCFAVTTYIAANRPTSETLAQVENRKQVELGQEVYQANCIKCHGGRLKGKPTWHKTITSPKQAGTPLNADGVTWHLSDQRLFDAIATGDRVKNSKTKRIHDKGFQEKLNEQQIWSLIAYFKTTWTARQIESQKETSLRERPGK